MNTKLDHREKTILRMRQGRFVDKSGQRHPPMTLHEIGHYWNITRERVRQIQENRPKQDTQHHMNVRHSAPSPKTR